MCARGFQRLAFVVQEYIEWLLVGAELVALEIAPFFADGFEDNGAAVFFHCHWLRESCLVVNHENNHHIIAFEDAADGGSIEYCAFHFAAVYAGVSGEVHQYGFSFGAAAAMPCS